MDIIESINNLPEKRLNQIDKQVSNNNNNDDYQVDTFDDLLGDSYDKAYLLFCDLYSCSVFDEIDWVRRILNISCF
jgi:hypothetical protein